MRNANQKQNHICRAEKAIKHKITIARHRHHWNPFIFWVKRKLFLSLAARSLCLCVFCCLPHRMFYFRWKIHKTKLKPNNTRQKRNKIASCMICHAIYEIAKQFKWHRIHSHMHMLAFWFGRKMEIGNANVAGCFRFRAAFACAFLTTETIKSIKFIARSKWARRHGLAWDAKMYYKIHMKMEKWGSETRPVIIYS